ncbi:hypothetical protein SYNPS1DRAFT_31706 [Syncephalis pseudoplumigaleata]|uniref:Uncharacterized protein n=1 Tax=Syncephalis pseudoplumigaleata TaxID=1712513 RepID=A0A4P9YS04_9FUNG|nr:hypothetical protein SYNPS1DRAFT_31706 [Syncephalis pseudoplumigaleata]|eukprot:RKP22676.1 hypothetical protein SYNPS1DRAFT_31706 [Syncephalis pseudoplumigaleata]
MKVFTAAAIVAVVVAAVASLATVEAQPALMSRHVSHRTSHAIQSTNHIVLAYLFHEQAITPFNSLTMRAYSWMQCGTPSHSACANPIGPFHSYDHLMNRR